jgi:SAM-dependent methyltransferase
MTDEYDDETFRWWHLSGPSPELVRAHEDGWLGLPGSVLDVGCGLGSELAHLSSLGWQAVGMDLSISALRRAKAAHQAVAFLEADALSLPFTTGSFDVALDRGCFHYLLPADRPRYLQELERVLRPGGHLLLRACRRSAGTPNDLTAGVLESLLHSWRIVELREEEIVSDTRLMPSVVARAERRS